MTKWFDKLTTRWKLAIVTAATTAVALIIAGALIVTLDSRRYETQKVEGLTTEAKIVAANVVGALVFNDAATALNALNALSSNPEIEAGAAYDGDGALLARYTGPNARQRPLPDRAPPLESHINEQDVTVAVPVVQDNAAVGTVFLAARVESAGQRLVRQILVILVIGFSALCAALPLSMWLHRSITNPIEELAAKNAIIQTTLESVDHGVLVVDKDMRISFLNDRVMAICKISPEDLGIGMSFGEAVRRQQPDRASVTDAWVQAKLEKVRKLDGVRREFILADGKTAVEYRQAALADGGFVRTYTDVTEQKEFQQTLQAAKSKAEEADRAKSQFLAAMSHEIRTPMNGVIGLIELLHATPLSDEQRQMVEIIRQSGTGLLDVINDILDYSKIEAGRMTIESTRFALGDVIETTTTAISGHTKSKTLNVMCQVDPAIDWFVAGDPVRIRQVILNLMGNALKFTEMGSIELEATLDSVSSDTVTVLFEVRDTGIGIPAEKTARLFDRFSQADYSTTRRFGGTGLGLSISKNLVELMGGDIGVRSVAGQGSTFWFKIPFTRLRAAERENPFEIYSAGLRGVRVLVCDRLADRAAITGYLRAIGLEVIEAQSISRAIESLYQADAEGRPIDLAILRIHLGEDSAALFEHELGRRKSLEHTKVMLVLPNMSASAARYSAKEVFHKTISSPVARGVLYDAVAALLGRRFAGSVPSAGAHDLNFTAPSLRKAGAQGAIILVAEDNETNTFVIKTQLKRLGYAAEFAGDGREAWQVLKGGGGRYGMVLTDCHMPFMDGYQFTGMVRAREQNGGRRLPVVALTANALEGESNVCLAAGMDDYLSKPVNLTDLDKMVRKWLPKAAAMRGTAGGPPLETLQPAGAAPMDPGATARKGTPIDMAALGVLLGESDPLFLREILESFLTTMDGTPAALRDLAAGDDALTLINAAHAAKGAAASACADELAALCKQLEEAGRNEDWPEIRQVMPEVDTAFEDVRLFIEGELSVRASEGRTNG
jgi:signal transduction histidine kinase/CheY-like chemotaxis protein